MSLNIAVARETFALRETFGVADPESRTIVAERETFVFVVAVGRADREVLAIGIIVTAAAWDEFDDEVVAARETAMRLTVEFDSVRLLVTGAADRADVADRDTIDEFFDVVSTTFVVPLARGEDIAERGVGAVSATAPPDVNAITLRKLIKFNSFLFKLRPFFFNYDKYLFLIQAYYSIQQFTAFLTQAPNCFTVDFLPDFGAVAFFATGAFTS